MERSKAVTANGGDSSERRAGRSGSVERSCRRAEALFLDRGFIGASVEEVAVRAAVSKTDSLQAV